VCGMEEGWGWGCGGRGRGNVMANFSRREALDRKKSHGPAVLWLFNRCTYQI
jgi:hypothetical protein